MRSIAGFDAIVIDTGSRDDDLTYSLELAAEDLAEAKLMIKQAEICLINICTILRCEHDEKEKLKKLKIDVNKLPKEQLRFPIDLNKIPKTKKKWKQITPNDDWEPMK
jgi:hypothetical protein